MPSYTIPLVGGPHNGTSVAKSAINGHEFRWPSLQKRGEIAVYTLSSDGSTLHFSRSEMSELLLAI